MSLYNVLFGQNPLSDLFLGMIGLTRPDTGRFRDAYIEKTEDGEGWVLCVYTRNGGGNRQHWDDEKDPGPECGCTGCIGTYRLPSNPHYLNDEDDDFDHTYATYKFRVPPQFGPFMEELQTNSSVEATPTERWNRLLEKLRSTKEDPEVRNAMSVMAPIMEQIQSALGEKADG